MLMSTTKIVIVQLENGSLSVLVYKEFYRAREAIFGVPELKSSAGAHFPTRVPESRGWDGVGATRNPELGLIYIRLTDLSIL